jgi:hypothetical protein
VLERVEVLASSTKRWRNRHGRCRGTSRPADQLEDVREQVVEVDDAASPLERLVRSTTSGNASAFSAPAPPLRRVAAPYRAGRSAAPAPSRCRPAPRTGSTRIRVSVSTSRSSRSRSCATTGRAVPPRARGRAGGGARRRGTCPHSIARARRAAEPAAHLGGRVAGEREGEDAVRMRRAVERSAVRSGG